jgi:hypothetical protein
MFSRKQIFSHISDKISCIKIFSQKMVSFLHVADKVCLRFKKFKKNVDIFAFFHIFASNFSQKCKNDFRDNFRENANTKIFVETLTAACIRIRLRAGGKVEEPIPTKGPRASTVRVTRDPKCEKLIVFSESCLSLFQAQN